MQISHHPHLPRYGSSLLVELAAERDQVLAEVRGHLEERASALQETGVSEAHAERQAVLAFGPVLRISRELQCAHPIAWGKRRWLGGIVGLPFLALYLVLPFVWGRRAQHWWVPGLVYGLGARLPAVLWPFGRMLSTMMGFHYLAA